MKKLLILIGAAVLLFGCTGPMGPQGLKVRREKDSQTFTLTYKLASGRLGEEYRCSGQFHRLVA